MNLDFITETETELFRGPKPLLPSVLRANQDALVFCVTQELDRCGGQGRPELGSEFAQNREAWIPHLDPGHEELACPRRNGSESDAVRSREETPPPGLGPQIPPPALSSGDPGLQRNIGP